MRRGWTLIETLCVLIILAMFVPGAVWTVAKWRAHRACIQLGYPEAKVTIPDLATYCIKRVNQTDSVVALSKIKK